MGMYRQFRELNALNLLYLQAELVNMEYTLKIEADTDMKVGDQRRGTYSVDFFSLSRSSMDGHGKQWRTMLDVRDKLEEYSMTTLPDHALIQQQLRGKFEALNRRDLNTLREWLLGEHQGNSSLIGLDRNIWKDGVELIAPHPRVHDDALSRWLCGPFIHFFHRVLRRRKNLAADCESGLVEYADAMLLGIADIIGTILSSLMPISSVITLYFVPNLLVRLGIVTFTLLFSITLRLVTKARRVEIFAATAAYDAPLYPIIVFTDGLQSFAGIQVV
ncbi:hypothetical protein MMC17_010292 [Xylographa soralifera]|nr:hypothetical protein [Xylographa soralifera]